MSNLQRATDTFWIKCVDSPKVIHTTPIISSNNEFITLSDSHDEDNITSHNNLRIQPS